MILTRSKIEAMKEMDLLRSVLLPLFKAMGYKDVRENHGGPREEGKDIVMWKVDDFGVRRNYAVVVKA